MARQASISTIRNSRSFSTAQRGFTLPELMIAAVLSAIVFVAIFSAYIFMARNLTRIANFQQQQVQNRRVLYVMGKDVNEAVLITSPPDAISLPTAAFLGLKLPPRAPNPNPTFLTYTYDSTTGTLTRHAVTGVIVTDEVLLSNLTSFNFVYFDEAGVASPPLVHIKQIQFNFSSAVGDGANGTRAGDTVASARMVLRSKPPLGQ